MRISSLRTRSISSASLILHSNQLLKIPHQIHRSWGAALETRRAWDKSSIGWFLVQNLILLQRQSPSGILRKGHSGKRENGSLTKLGKDRRGTRQKGLRKLKWLSKKPRKSVRTGQPTFPISGESFQSYQRMSFLGYLTVPLKSKGTR